MEVWQVKYTLQENSECLEWSLLGIEWTLASISIIHIENKTPMP